MMLEHYHIQTDVVNTDILKDDAITFSVLMSILHGKCTDIYTDHHNIIICYSNAPYPVWVWCRDIDDTKQIACVASCLKENFPAEDGFTYDLEESLLAKLKEYDNYFEEITALYGLLSYRLDELKEIPEAFDGSIYIPAEEDIPYMTKLWKDFEYEAEGIEFDDELCLKTVSERVRMKTIYAWKNDAGQITAMASRWGGEGQFCKIASVYTLPEFRRKGYAMNLVHHICRQILNEGLTPILYTDESYYASNECYKKIGFYKVGNLIKAGLKESV